MSSGFKEEVVVLTSNSNDKVVNFLNELRVLLDKHNAKLYATDCELFMNGLGYVGMLEDNIETIEISDGAEIIYTSTINNI
tara:strand:- start:800 stop:1042 length:243 start_codon:yes stop_codon:yes gene_type:complete